MVAVGAFAVVFVAFVLFTWVRYFRYTIDDVRARNQESTAGRSAT